MSDILLRHAESDAETAACFPVMVRLRPHLANADELVARVARQRAAGYRILSAWRDGVPVGLAGYRIEENLIHGRFVYVDDLVTAEGERKPAAAAARIAATPPKHWRHAQTTRRRSVPCPRATTAAGRLRR